MPPRAPTRHNPPSAVIRADDPAVAELDRVIGDLLAAYACIAALVSERRDAVRHADTARLADCIARESECVQAVADIEKRRIGVVGRLAERLGSAERTQARMAWIAERIEPPAGERLLRRAQDLRGRLEEVRRENEIVHMATTRLATHMEGLWRQSVAVLNHSKTYGRLGAVEPGPQVVSALDLKS